MKFVLSLLLALCLPLSAGWTQGTGVNPPVGSIWTYLGATYGAGWAPVPAGSLRTPENYGAACNGIVDDTPAFQAALDAGPNNYLFLSPFCSYYIGGNLTVPHGATIKGPFANVGAPNYHNTYYNFSSTPSIRLSSSATINMQDGSTIDGVLIYRAGMTFPAPDSSAFAGTAITVAGDSFTLKNSLVMGFNMAVTAGFDGLGGRDKGLIENVNFDNQSNIQITGAADTWKINNIHAWPWSVGAGGAQEAFYRTGTNFYQKDSNDASLISDYLAFGYKTSFSWENVAGSTCTNCDADGHQEQPDVIGFVVIGTSTHNTLINPKVFGRRIGVFIDTRVATPEAATVSIAGGSMAGVLAYGVQVAAASTGILQMNGVSMDSVNYAMQILSATQIVHLSAGNTIGRALQDVPVNVPVPTANVFVGANNILGNPATHAGRTIMGQNASVPLIAVSGGSLSLPPSGNVFQVSNGGTAAFINSEWAGRVVTLIFRGVTTLQHTGTGAFGSLTLNGGVGFVSTANSTITLTSTGGTTAGWYEVGRMKP